MPDQLPAEREQIGPWHLSHIVLRTVVDATNAANKQSRRWLALWNGVALLVTVLLALADAPLVSYAVPFATLLSAAHAGIHQAGPPP